MSVGPNDYSAFQKRFYSDETPNMRVQNHRGHNTNSRYWDILLGDIRADPERWAGKNALDVGCGCGRNLLNMASLARWATVDGCDISAPNCEETRNYMWINSEETHVETYPTNGYELDGVPSDRYDFVMSTIVLQHICVHDIRLNLLREVFRVMRPGGLFSFQMGFGRLPEGGAPGVDSQFADYFENRYDARRTNSGFDVRIERQEDLTGDLKRIGFEIVDVQITESFDNPHHPQWIWVKARRPE